MDKLIKEIEKSIGAALGDVQKMPSRVYGEADLVHLIHSHLGRKKTLRRDYQIHQEVNRGIEKSDRGKFDLAVTNKWIPKERGDLKRAERRKKLRPKIIIEVKHLDPSGESLAGDLRKDFYVGRKVKKSYVGRDVEKLKRWIKDEGGRKAFFVIYSVARGAKHDFEKNVIEKLKKLLKRKFGEEKKITKKTCLIVFLLVPPVKDLKEKWTLKPFYCALKSGK